MFSALKRLATFSFVLAIANIIATLLLLFYFMELASFAARFTWILYTFSASIGFLVIAWGLFGLSKDLEQETNSNAEYINKLAKRIKELENRVY